MINLGCKHTLQNATCLITVVAVLFHTSYLFLPLFIEVVIVDNEKNDNLCGYLVYLTFVPQTHDILYLIIDNVELEIYKKQAKNMLLVIMPIQFINTITKLITLDFAHLFYILLNAETLKIK